MHRTDSYIVNGADLTFHGVLCCFKVYILQRTEIEVNITINHGIK